MRNAANCARVAGILGMVGVFAGNSDGPYWFAASIPLVIGTCAFAVASLWFEIKHGRAAKEIK